jgi:uncharacterized small protein (DUF1192 family)
MPARSAVRALLAAAFVALPSAATSADGPVVYKWVDADGIPHFTTHLDRVPAAVRDKVREAATAPSPASPPAGERQQTAPPDVAASPPASEASAPAGEFRESERPSQDASPQAPLGTPAPAAGASAPDAQEMAAATPAGADALEARIAALEQEIGRDQAALEDFLSEPPQQGAPLLPDRPEFREIAHRLPKLQAELARLKEERAQRATP